MANKVYNMEGGLHSAAAYSAFENAMYGSCVAGATDFVATAGTGMNVSLSAGNGMIDTGLGYSRRIASDATNTIPVTAASSANPRKDALVAYIDNGVTPTTSVIDNTNDILKFACVAGSPAASPQAPSDATIQTAIGAGNPYVVLWYITIPTSATSLSTATFTDNRYVASLINSANIADGAITTSKLDDGAVTTAKLAGSSVTKNKIAASVLEYQAGDSVTISSGDNTYFAGRTRVISSNKYIWFNVQLDRPVSTSVTTTTFTMAGYQEAFGADGLIVSKNNPSASVLTINCYVSNYNRTIIYCTMEIKDETTITSNRCCSVHIGGAFTFS